MKKILFSLLICFVFASVIYADVSTNKVDGTPPSLTYSLIANPDSVDSINVGFSTNAVPSHNTEVKLHSGNQDLSVNDGEFVGTHTGEIHVYWKLYTDNDITLTLTPTAMKGSEGNEDTLDVILTTENDSNQDDLKGVTRSEISYDTTAGAAGNTSLILLKYDSSATDNKEAAGSQTVKITTENIAGHTADTYSGTLTLTISTDPISG